MKPLKLFMGNPCGYGNCMRTDCEKCCHYTPTIFGVKVPKWLGNVGFWLEWQILRLKEISERKTISKLKETPTADVMDVVRCKDCKHLMFSDMYGECSQAHMGIVRPDDYCSYGERKDR